MAPKRVARPPPPHSTASSEEESSVSGPGSKEEQVQLETTKKPWPQEREDKEEKAHSKNPPSQETEGSNSSDDEENDSSDSDSDEGPVPLEQKGKTVLRAAKSPKPKRKPSSGEAKLTTNPKLKAPHGVAKSPSDPKQKVPASEAKSPRKPKRKALLGDAKSPEPKRKAPAAEAKSPEAKWEASTVEAEAPKPKGNALAVEAEASEQQFKANRTLPFQCTWSAEDEVRILEALAAHHQNHSSLAETKAVITSLAGQLDKGCGRREITEKVRCLKRRFDSDAKKGAPSKDHERRLYDLSKIVWGDPQPDTTAAATAETGNGDALDVDRKFEEMKKLYPELVDMAMDLQTERPMFKKLFLLLDDNKLRALNTKLEKQMLAQVKVQMRIGDIRKELIKALIDLHGS